jgi:hypothetical protein
MGQSPTCRVPASLSHLSGLQMFTSTRSGLTPKGDPFLFTPMASLGKPWTEYVAGERRMIEACLIRPDISYSQYPSVRRARRGD